MAKYLLLYRGGGMPETEAEQAAAMQAWDDWFHRIGGAVADGGNPFAPSSKTIAKDCPVLQGGASIAVYETFEVM